MNEIETLRERLRLATEALSAIAADSEEATAAWKSEGCDAGDAISHVADTGERARTALATIAGPVTPSISIIKIGITGVYHCYLNVPMAEALRRYEMDSGNAYDPSYERLETMLATDHIEAYDLHVPSPRTRSAGVPASNAKTGDQA